MLLLVVGWGWGGLCDEEQCWMCAVVKRLPTKRSPGCAGCGKRVGVGEETLWQQWEGSTGWEAELGAVGEGQKKGSKR